MAARTGMTNLIKRLRGMTEAGTADYSVAGVDYWSNEEVQRVLDNHRNDIFREQLLQIKTYADGGSIDYFEYRSGFNDYEETTGGTAIFFVELSTGEAAGTADYSVDYQLGIVTFGADQGGTAWFLTGRSYNLNTAAADIWRQKAAHLAQTAMNFKTDGHSFNRNELVKNALQMAEEYDRIGGSIQTVEMFV